MNFGIEFLQKLQKFGSRSALVFETKNVTFDEFFAKTQKWIAYFEENREKCARIATFCTNSPEFLQILIASQIAGIVIAPLNPSYKKYEIEMFLKKCSSKFAIISDDLEDLDRFSGVEFRKIGEILAEIEHLEHVVDLPTRCEGSIQFFSSGTTGPPKIFEYTQRMLCAQLEQWRAIDASPTYFSPRESDISYGVLPYFHAGGLLTVLSMLWSGSCVVVNTRWDERQFLATIQQHRVTILFVVPPVLSFLAAHPLLDEFDLSSVATIYVGAAASRLEHFQMVPKRLPRLCNFIQVYGTTECGVLLCSTLKGLSDGKSVGLPFPGVQIKIEESRILIKSETAIENGFMDTGDLGRMENGQLQIIGRSKEMLKVRGWQVNPNEIENLIRSVEGVLDCAVYQDPKTCQLIAKVIRVGDIVNLENNIIETVKKCLARYKHVDRVIFVGDFPRNSSGKLIRRELVD